MEEAGFSDRLTAEVPPGLTRPCSPGHGPFDAVMALFTLSADSPRRAARERGAVATCVSHECG